MSIKKILYEPFFHFLLLGGVIYLYYDAVSVQAPQNTQKSIKVSSFEVSQLQTSYKNMWHRDANDAELKAMIKEYYHNNIISDEALTLELEKSDLVIMQRLIEKMKYILSNSSKLKEPSEDELKTYYKKHLDNYLKPEKISFSHIYFKQLSKKQREFIKNLFEADAISAKDAHFFGDSFDGKSSIEDMDFLTCKEKFGNYFTTRIFALATHRWSDDIRSKMGVHFVYVDKKSAKETYSFDEIEYRVYNDYIADQKRESYNKAFKKIATQYRLERE
jgi:hypothetical protein